MRLKNYLTEQDMVPKDAKILNYPEFRQVYTWDCGANALQTVLIYYGIDVREKTLMNQLGTTSEHGTPVINMVEIIKGAEYYGLEAEDKDDMTIDDLKHAIDNGWPTIIAIQAYMDKDDQDEHAIEYKNNWNEGHYVVVIGYDDKNIYFEDPSDTKRTFLSYDEFNDRWHDMDDDGKKYEHWGIICKGKPSFKSNAITYLESKNYPYYRRKK